MPGARRVATALVSALTLAGCAGQAVPSAPRAEAEWTKLSSFPLAPRQFALTAWTGSEVLVVGGDTSPACPPNADCAGPVSSTRDGAAFDPATNTWRRIADAPIPVHGYLASGVVGDTVYVWEDGQLLSYDASDDAWTAEPAPAPAEWNGPRLAVLDDRVVIVSNERLEGQPSGVVFDTSSGTWSELPEDPLGLAFDRTVTATPAGLVLTGATTFPTENSSEPSLVRAAVLDPATSRWRLLDDSTMLGGWAWAWTGQRMVDPSLGTANGGEVGGYGRDIPLGGTLDPATGTWGTLPNAPEAASDGWQVEAYGGVLSALDGWIYDDRDGSWTVITRPEGAPPTPGTAVWAGDRLVVVGGIASDQTTLTGGAWMWTPPSSSVEGTEVDVVGAWAVLEGTAGGSPIRLPEQRRGTIEFTADHRVSGTSFCNGFGGTYRLDGADLVLEDVAGTLIACEGDVGAAEAAFSAVLFDGALRAEVADDGLVITGAGGSLTFYRLPPVPVTDVVGTRWVLESVQEGGTTTSAVGTPAVLELREDGSATVSTGCREFEASWQAHGDSVFLGDYAYDDVGCPDPVGSQDRLVLDLLGGGFQLSVDGDQLTVTSAATSTALGYRAG